MKLILRTVRGLLVAAFLLLIVACGDDPTEVTSGQPVDDDRTGQEVAQDPIDDDSTEPGETTSPGDAAYERTQARIELGAPTPALIDELVVDADGTTVLVRFQNAAEPCSGARVAVTETDMTVEVALETGLDPNAAAMTCIAQVIGYEIAVPLGAPVGSRELIAVPPGPAEPVVEDPFEGAEFPTDQYLGLTEAEAMELGEVEQRVVRVARIDDEFFVLTQDFSPTRVNIEIEAGVVVTATSG